MLEDGQAKHHRSKLDGCKSMGPEDAGDVGPCCCETTLSYLEGRGNQERSLMTRERCLPSKERQKGECGEMPRKIMKQALRDSFQGGIFSLFSTLVKLQVGYHVQFGAPSTKKDVDLLERGISRWLEDWSVMCEERVRELRLHHLKRLKG